jgi:Tfp pilus assembly protein PilO
MQNKLSEKEKSMLLLLLALALLAIAYFFLYQGTMKKVSALKTENETLAARVADLEAKEANKEATQADTEEKNRLAAKMIELLPAAQTIQNGIAILDNIEKTKDFTILSESFAMNTEYWQSTGLDEPMTGYQSQITLAYQTTYKDLKEVLTYLNDYQDRITVNNVTTAYSAETGELTGNMTLSLYSLAGTDREYTEPIIGRVTSGVDNIFRTKE